MYCQSSSIRKARSNVLSERFSSERNARLRFPYIGSTPTFYISICTQERCLLDGIYSPRQTAYCNSQNETRAVVNKHVCHIEIRRSFCGQWTYIAKGKLSWAVRAFKWSRLWQHARFSGHFLFTESTLLSVVISFAAKAASYASGFALHRCRLESNLKSSGCLFQVKLLMTVSL